VANVPDHVATEEQVLRAMKFGARRLPGTLGILPADPLNEIILDESILRSHTADSFDTDVPNRVSAHDVRVASKRITHAAPVLPANVEAHAIGPFDGVSFDNPVVPAAS
jgi:hypothetical protein